MKRWSREQVAILRERYADTTAEALKVSLAPHSQEDIWRKASSLGLRKRKNWYNIANQYASTFSFRTNHVREVSNHRVPINQIESAENERANDR